MKLGLLEASFVFPFPLLYKGWEGCVFYPRVRVQSLNMWDCLCKAWMYVSHFVLIQSATLRRFDSVNVWACHFSSWVVGGSLSLCYCHHLHATLRYSGQGTVIEYSGVFQWWYIGGGGDMGWKLSKQKKIKLPFIRINTCTITDHQDIHTAFSFT
jgi:hypothetical protein